MSLVECRECKTLVSTNAEICPKCGVRYPATNIPSKGIFHRKSDYPAPFIKMQIYINNEKKGELKKNEACSFELPEGDYILRISNWTGSGKQIALKILHSKIYHIEGSFNRTGMDIEVSTSDQ